VLESWYQVDFDMKSTGKIAKEVYEKYRKGDPIGNTELAIAAAYFQDLSDKLMPLGDVFRLAAREALEVYANLECFLSARNMRPKPQYQD
jgi:hypothetical protein